MDVYINRILYEQWPPNLCQLKNMGHFVVNTLCSSCLVCFRTSEGSFIVFYKRKNCLLISPETHTQHKHICFIPGGNFLVGISYSGRILQIPMDSNNVSLIFLWISFLWIVSLEDSGVITIYVCVKLIIVIDIIIFLYN